MNRYTGNNTSLHDVELMQIMRHIAGFLSALLITTNATAVTVIVDVKTPDDSAMPGAVVVLQAINQQEQLNSDSIAIMDQVDRQFKPRILAVPKGAPVSFPNSDSIKHHVYSFSPAKVFEIQLYKGSDNEPVIFNKAGVVELGCNVHDWMLGYIYVADSPYFAQLDEQNQTTLDVPKGQYKAWVWHPRLSSGSAANEMTLKVEQDMTTTLIVNGELSPDPFAEEELSLDEFDIYE